MASPSPVGGLDVADQPTYTFRRNSTGETITLTDPDRGLINGRWADLGFGIGSSEQEKSDLIAFLNAL